MLISIKNIKEHPDNHYFFDDMEGGKWEDFLESIKQRGVIENPILTENYVIVGGHQRIRACRELGITEVECEIRHYDTESAILRDLIEMNVQQRGEIVCSRIKKARIIRALEEFYGVKHGGDRKSTEIKCSNGTLDRVDDSSKLYNVQLDHVITSSDIQSKLGMSQSEYAKTKSILALIPSIQDQIEDGQIPFRAASDILTKLTEEEQEQLLASLPVAQKFTAKQVQSYVDKLHGVESERDELKAELSLVEGESIEAQRQLKESKDAEEYVTLAKKYQDEQQKARDLDSQNQKLKQRIIKSENAQSDQLVKAQSELEKANRRIEEAEKEKQRAIEEAVKAALTTQQPAKEKDEKTRSRFGANLDPIKVAQNFSSEFQVHAGDFLARVRGCAMNKEYLDNATPAIRRLVMESLSSIIANANQIITYLEESPCKIA